MFLRENYNKKTGRTYLQIVHGYRDKDGKSKSKTIKSIGYLDELEKVYDEPIAHFKQVAKQMENERLENDEITIKIKSNSRISKDEKNRKNFGHVVFNKVFHELQLNRFFNNKQRHERFEYDSNSIMKVLLFARLLYPCSKKRRWKSKTHFLIKPILH